MTNVALDRRIEQCRTSGGRVLRLSELPDLRSLPIEKLSKPLRATVSRLSARKCGLESLDGLELFTGLVELKVSDNRALKILPEVIASHQKLEILDISSTDTGDFSFLRFVDLDYLSVRGLSLAALAADIRHSKTIRFLDVSGGRDWTPDCGEAIGTLTSLEFIDLSDVEGIVDFSFLASLPLLRVVRLDGTQVRDLRFAKNLPLLQGLTARKTLNLRSLSGIEGHKALQLLDLTGSAVRDLYPVRKLEGLAGGESKSPGLLGLRLSEPFPEPRLAAMIKRHGDATHDETTKTKAIQVYLEGGPYRIRRTWDDLVLSWKFALQTDAAVTRDASLKLVATFTPFLIASVMALFPMDFLWKVFLYVVAFACLFAAWLLNYRVEKQK